VKLRKKEQVLAMIATGKETKLKGGVLLELQMTA
jgi:hypothetical protein